MKFQMKSLLLVFFFVSLSIAQSSTATKRVMKELYEQGINPFPNFAVSPIDSNIMVWTASFVGPETTPYEGGMFSLNIVFPPDYPYKPPKVTFKTQIYHPQVHTNGKICLSILLDSWTPTSTIVTVFSHLISMLMYIDTDNALMPAISHQYITDKARFIQTAKDWTKKYAT